MARLDFSSRERLQEGLCGATTLYNTYWVRFCRGEVTFELAVDNTRLLLEAALAAGVRRIVHISVTNPSHSSALPYFRGKAEVEDVIKRSGLSYAILRPALIFGQGDILINNIAWLLRRFPLFLLPGTGSYRLQPIFAPELADIAVRAADRQDDFVADALGPDVYTFEEMVRLTGQAVGSRCLILPAPRRLALFCCRLLGAVLKDVILTSDEIEGLSCELLVSDGAIEGVTRLSDWLRENGADLGVHYASELFRHFEEREG